MAGGESSAIGELYELIKTDIYAYAISKVGNRTDAEDITHDTFVQIYKHSTQYRPQGKPMAWIFTVEMNLIRRFFQLNSRTIALDESLDTECEDVDFTDGVINNVFLTELLKNLGEEEREIISLHVVSGIKHKDIARLLDKPLSTVLSRYNRAIKKLQLIVKEGQ